MAGVRWVLGWQKDLGNRIIRTHKPILIRRGIAAVGIVARLGARQALAHLLARGGARGLVVGGVQAREILRNRQAAAVALVVARRGFADVE